MPTPELIVPVRQMHASWKSLKKLNFCFGVACHVTRAAFDSNHCVRFAGLVGSGV